MPLNEGICVFDIFRYLYLFIFNNYSLIFCSLFLSILSVFLIVTNYTFSTDRVAHVLRNLISQVFIHIMHEMYTLIPVTSKMSIFKKKILYIKVLGQK